MPCYRARNFQVRTQITVHQGHFESLGHKPLGMEVVLPLQWVWLTNSDCQKQYAPVEGPCCPQLLTSCPTQLLPMTAMEAEARWCVLSMQS